MTLGCPTGYAPVRITHGDKDVTFKPTTSCVTFGRSWGPGNRIELASVLPPNNAS